MSTGEDHMKKAFAIAGALLVVLSACGTASVDSDFVELESPGEETAAVIESEGDGAAAEPSRSADQVESTTTTTAGAVTTTTVTSVPSTTARATSSADGAAGEDTSTIGVEEKSDDSAEETVVTGQVPPALMSQVLAHAESHTGQAADTMTIVQAEAVTWPDGSLGCPEPGMQYTQALVPGYWIEIAVGGETLDYRLSERGGMKLCEGEGLIPSPREDT
jgi:hypothetical protein